MSAAEGGRFIMYTSLLWIILAFDKSLGAIVEERRRLGLSRALFGENSHSVL